MKTCPNCGGQLTYLPLENDLTNIEGEMICEPCGTKFRWEYQFSIKALAIIAATPMTVGFVFWVALGRPEGRDLSMWYWLGLIAAAAIALRLTRLSMRRLVVEDSNNHRR